MLAYLVPRFFPGFKHVNNIGHFPKALSHASAHCGRDFERGQIFGPTLARVVARLPAILIPEHISARRHIKLIHSPAERLGLNMAAKRHSRFSPECEVAHPSPRNVSRRLARPGDGEGTGSWPPENPPFVKSANGGV
jgi:hypothetical protein